MAIKIEHNKPIPIGRRGRGDSIVADMAALMRAPIGASAFFAKAKRASLLAAISYVGGPGWAKCRPEGKGHRVWKFAQPTRVHPLFAKKQVTNDPR